MSETLYLFADGSCSAFPEAPDGDIGAWAVVLAGSDGYRRLLYGVDFPTTISKCELLPILNALVFIDKKSLYKRFKTVIVISDSEFVIKTLSDLYKTGEYIYLLRAIENYQTWFTGNNCCLRYVWRERNSHPFMQVCDSQAYALRSTIIGSMKNVAGESFLTPADSFGLEKIIIPTYDDEQTD